MMLGTLFLLSSGLFLGWSLGSNDAANIFGTAVGTRMIRFKTAAIISSIFVIIGATVSGAGASHTLGKLGEVTAMSGAFTVALGAALTVLWMTHFKLPVSTSQAVVGSIIGWNFFSKSPANWESLSTIFGAWIFSPVLSAVFAFIFFHIIKLIIDNSRIHLVRLDSLTRWGLIIVGAFGAYSLGANNIGNVMGVFINTSPFHDITIGSFLKLSSVQQLFLLGGIAISVGIFTYSKRVMLTVGNNIFKLSPLTAFVAVLSSSIVLFLFASQSLKTFLVSHGLPSFPLVPVSSSQSIVGAIIGISLAKNLRNTNFRVLGKISLGWITTPIGAALATYILLFFMQNVFGQTVFTVG